MQTVLVCADIYRLESKEHDIVIFTINVCNSPCACRALTGMTGTWHRDFTINVCNSPCACRALTGMTGTWHRDFTINVCNSPCACRALTGMTGTQPSTRGNPSWLGVKNQSSVYHVHWCKQFRLYRPIGKQALDRSAQCSTTLLSETPVLSVVPHCSVSYLCSV